MIADILVVLGVGAIGVGIIWSIGAGALRLPGRGVPRDHQGNTDLHTAAIAGDEETLKAAIKAMGKKTIDCVNYDERTPLHVACRNDKGEAARILLEAGADPHRKDGRGRTPIMNAALLVCPKAFEAVFEKSRLDLKDNNGQTVLAIAAMVNHRDMVAAVLETGKVDVNDTDDQGMTPLHHAVYHRNVKMIEALRRRGATANAKSKRNTTPMSMAEEIHAGDPKREAVIAALKG